MTSRMRAVICTAYGGPEVLQLGEVEKPVPQAGEVCVAIRATAVTASDGIIRSISVPIWKPIGLLMRLVVGFGKPRNPILGLVFAGDVESVGEGVTAYREGEAVFGFTGTRFGCYAEYTCVPVEDTKRSLGHIPSVIAPKPSNLTYEEAVAIPYGGLLALHYLRKANLQPSQKILVYGASGAIGTAAVQIATSMGAEVTGVCSAKNADLVKSLGALEVIDYTSTESLPTDARYHVVLDAVGKRKTSALKTQAMQALLPDGTAISVDDGSPTPQPDMLVQLKAWAEAGTLKAIIDRTYALDDIVEAHRYVDAGHKRGNVVIRVAD
jgi:NADPH:quinone reductase-like Zn-dependent oxidoreductase